MRKAEVIFNGKIAGYLIKEDDGDYVFTYNKVYLNDPRSEPVSLTLPKRCEPYRSSTLFPFFFGLLAEGEQKDLQLRILGIQEKDLFSRLVYSAGETIGSVTLREVQ